MIIVMKASAPQKEAAKIISELEEKGLTPVPLYGVERTVIAVIGEDRDINVGHLESLSGVEKVMRVLQPYKLVSREIKKEPTIIEVNGVRIGDPTQVAIMAGPCSVESLEQMEEVASNFPRWALKFLEAEPLNQEQAHTPFRD